LLELVVGRLDRADGVGIWRDYFRGPPLAGGHVARPVAHFAVGEGGTVFDDEHPLAPDRRAVFDVDGRDGVHDGGAGVDRDHVAPYLLDSIKGRGILFVDDYHVGAPDVGLAGVVGQLVAGSEGVYHDDSE